MKSYFRVMLGPKSVYASQCYKENFIGADYSIRQDLSSDLPEQWREFNRKFIPVWLNLNPSRTKIAAGLACGMLWTVCKGMKKGDIVLCPDGTGTYYVGEIIGDYKYITDGVLPHRREVQWHKNAIDRNQMSPELQQSTRSTGTLSNITRYSSEIELFLSGNSFSPLISTDESVEDPINFALEKHLEDFLVENWTNTELGKEYDIYEEEGELVGQQYPSDTGNIDILAVSKDKRTLLVIELKKGRASDVVVGQIQRYMGYVLEELAENNQIVKGIIIALDDDIRIRRALKVTNNIEFSRYKVDFKFIKN